MVEFVSLVWVTRSIERTDLLPRSGEVKDVELGEGLKGFVLTLKVSSELWPLPYTLNSVLFCIELLFNETFRFLD